MSVINKMLRDLDQRQIANQSDTATNRVRPAPELHRGTQSVPLKPSIASPIRVGRRAWWAATALVLAMGLGAAGWWSYRGDGWGAIPGLDMAPTTARSSAPITVPVTAVPSVPATPMPAASQSVAAAEVPAASASEPAMLPVATPLKTPSATVAAIGAAPTLPVAPTSPTVRPALGSRTTVAAANGPLPDVSLRMESTLSARKALDAVLSRPAAATASGASTPSSAVANKSNTLSAADATPNGLRQQQAGTDALSQAQTLWSAGSYAGAIDLMQQSVDAAERAAKAGTSAVGNPVLVSMVRELVRMQMAQSRFAAVWELLSRLEPVLGNQPDLWAIRAHTAQRLGHHQDSVNAYRIALQSRPEEQRWMLGAAVSLAALGQTAQAAEMADKARSVGDISREVQAYLRQMGVPLKDK